MADFDTCLPKGGDPAALAAAQCILQDFGSIFLGKEDPLPLRDADRPWPIEHHARIDTVPGAKPPSLPLRRLSPEKLKFLTTDLAKFLENNFIRPSSSPYGAPVLYACHPTTGERRFWIDYRLLNDITIKDKTPLPTITDLIAIVGSRQPRFFTVLDLKRGFHQIPVAAEDVHKTAFRCRYGLFEWLVMPFGLTNAPATFSRIVTALLRPFLDQFCVAYLDDILIFSQTLDEHKQHVRAVLEVLRNNQMSLNRAKCRLFVTEVTFLNFRLHAGRVSVVPSYVADLRSLADTPPRDSTDVRRFLGVANFYRSFIQGYANIAEPLINLTRKRVPFAWTPECRAAMATILDALSTGPILCLPEDKPFLLFTDASDCAIGACLMQRDDAGRPMPIAYFSRTLQGAERNYSAFDRELFAILSGVENFRPQLESRDDTAVYTDHRPIVDALKAPNLTTNAKHVRWIARITSFKVRVCYIPGGLNNVADLLSRPFGAANAKLAPATAGAPQPIRRIHIWTLFSTSRTRSRLPPRSGCPYHPETDGQSERMDRTWLQH